MKPSHKRPGPPSVADPILMITPQKNAADTVTDPFRLDGTWKKIHGALRDKVRRAAGRKGSPSAAIVDS